MFVDQDYIADWALESVEYCVEKGILKGKGDIFDPKEYITREEMAVILKRIVDKIE